MQITITKIKNHKNNFSLNFFLKFFRKYNYISKIFPKIYPKFDLKCFYFIVFKVLLLCCHQING